LAYSKLAQTYSNLRNVTRLSNFRESRGFERQASGTGRYLIQADYAEISNDYRKAISSYEHLEKVSPDDVDVHFQILVDSTIDRGSTKAGRKFAKVLRAIRNTWMPAGCWSEWKSKAAPAGSLDYYKSAPSFE